MKRYERFSRTIVSAAAIVALAAAAAGCGRATPTTPSSVAAMESPAVAGSGAQSFAATLDWACFTAHAAGILGSGAPACDSTSGMSASAGRLGTFAVPNPSGTLSASVNGSTVVLTWSAPAASDPPTSYVIEAGSAPAATNVASFDTGSVATSLAVSSVPSGTFFVRVRGRNASGLGPSSNEVTFSVGTSGAPSGCTGAPGAPSGLAASVAGSSLTLTWTAPAGCPATGYVIEAGSSAGASNLAVVSTGSAATTFSAGSVPNGTYYVRVRGANASGNSAASNEVVVTIGAPPTGGGGGGLTGRWLGLVANGDGLTSTTFGVERWDWQFDLTQSGNNVAGTLTQTDVIPCRDAPNCRVQTASLAGTVSGNTLSFTITTNRGPIVGSGTFTSARMTGSATTAGGETATFVLNKM